MQSDPLVFSKLHSYLISLQERCQGHTFLMTLHADPNGAHAGGTERHVNMVQATLWASGHHVIEMFPDKNAMICLRVRQDSQVLFASSFHQDCIPLLAPFFASCMDFLHVHHTLGWSMSALEGLLQANFSQKAITLHDFYLLCPSIHMLKEPSETEFCEVEQDSNVCNHCLRHFHGFRQGSIEKYRQQSLVLLQHADKIIVPSLAVKKYCQIAFQPAWLTIADKVTVLPHDISYLCKAADKIPEVSIANKSLVIFIGALSLHKGYHLMVGAARRLHQEGYQVEIWGRLLAYHPSLRNVTVRSYHSPKELRKLFSEHQPAYVIFPFLWPETFSYVFYEMMILGESAIPIVGKFGHPAEVIVRTGAGVVLPDMTVAGLHSAFTEAQQGYESILKHKQRVVAEWKRGEALYRVEYEKLFSTGLRAKQKSIAAESIDFNSLLFINSHGQRMGRNKTANKRSFFHSLWHLVKTRFCHPTRLTFYLGRGMQVFISEGLDGVKHRINKLFSA